MADPNPRLGNVLTNETDVLFAHQFNESAPCREFDFCNLMLKLASALGCERREVTGKRVKACVPLDDWRDLLHRSERGTTGESTQLGRDEL